MKQRVYVGLSGGVDSAVSAALLTEQGYQVVGVFIKIWQPEFIECTWRKDRLDAMRVCAHLGIPFKEIDLSEVYKERVIDITIRGYKEGITPNPDVLCNSAVKFGVFADWAWKEGADYIATGHYARVRHGAEGVELLRGVDTEKDQSYFLWSVSRESLAKTLFPVGSMTKSEVRARARALRLPVAYKADSQGLCFVGDVDMKTFLKRFITTSEGGVLNEKGRVIGVHDGAAFFTPGQRHGFRIHDSALGKKVHYVAEVRIDTNELVVSDSPRAPLRSGAALGSINFFKEHTPLPLHTDAQGRYRGDTAPCIVSRSKGGITASFSSPQLLTAGQSLVFYDSDVCLGGGVILPRALHSVDRLETQSPISEYNGENGERSHSESRWGRGDVRPVEA